MNWYNWTYRVIVMLLILQTGCGQNKSQNNKIVVAVSANMQYAFTQLSRKFTETTGIECEAVISSSGKLSAQIMAGAPFDAFLSADMKFPVELYEKGYTPEPPQVYAFGRMVLWSTVPELKPTINTLTSCQIKHIAIANPATAPYGTAANEVLTHFKLKDTIGFKIVQGESIAQVNQFVLSRSAEAGFTSMSSVLDPKVKGQGYWIEVDQHLFGPIEQGFVIIKQERTDNSMVYKFRDFLFSEIAQDMLKEYGYLINE